MPPGQECSTQLSRTLLMACRRIAPLSPRSVACGPMKQPSAISTSPMIQPVGCTQAPGSDARRDAIEAVRLLDTGLDTRQRPYLALQYVKGQSRREWCSAQRVGAFELTRLFCSWHRPLATFTAVVSCTAT